MRHSLARLKPPTRYLLRFELAELMLLMLLYVYLELLWVDGIIVATARIVLLKLQNCYSIIEIGQFLG